MKQTPNGHLKRSVFRCCISFFINPDLLHSYPSRLQWNMYHEVPLALFSCPLRQITAEASAGRAWQPQMCLMYKETSLGYLGKQCLKWRLYANTQTASAVNTFIIQERVCAVVCCQWCLSNKERTVQRDTAREEVSQPLKKVALYKHRLNCDSDYISVCLIYILWKATNHKMQNTQNMQLNNHLFRKQRLGVQQKTIKSYFQHES